MAGKRRGITNSKDVKASRAPLIRGLCAALTAAYLLFHGISTRGDGGRGREGRRGRPAPDERTDGAEREREREREGRGREEGLHVSSVLPAASLGSNSTDLLLF